jgi:hypothetical protein
MPTTYPGTPGNISGSLPAAIAVTSTSNSNPVIVTTSAPHGLTTGDVVDLTGNVSGDQRNGVWKVTVTGGSTFTIPFNGTGFAGGASGTVQPLKLAGPIQQPVDGDAATASSGPAAIDTTIDSLSDRTAFLGVATGAYKLAQVSIVSFASLSLGTWAAQTAGAITAGQLVQFTAQSVTWNTNLGPTGVTPVAANPPTFSFLNVSAGDYVSFAMETVAISDANILLLLAHAFITPTGVPAWPAAYTTINLSSRFIAAGTTVNVRLAGFVASAFSGTMFLQPIAKALTTATQSYTLEGDTTLTVELWRPTSMVQ